MNQEHEKPDEEIEQEAKPAAAEPGTDPAAAQAAAPAEAATQTIDETAAAEVLPEDSAHRLELILEALLLAADTPLSVEQLQKLVGAEFNLSRRELRDALEHLAVRYANTASELHEVASGWRLQVRAEYGEWIGRLWQEKPPRYSRALLETLALVVYRQPVTRGEIEDVRGVVVSTNILRTLLERGWIREVGHKEVPGRPALYGTTSQFLDDFNLKSLDQLPPLPEIKDLAQLEAALEKLGAGAPAGAEAPAGESETGEESAAPPESGEDQAPPPDAVVH
jgi:segregation and condensation protein B